MARGGSRKSVILMCCYPPYPLSMLGDMVKSPPCRTILSRADRLWSPVPPFNVEKCRRVLAAPPGGASNSTLNGGTGSNTTRTGKVRACAVNIEWGYGGRAAFSAKARACSVLCDSKVCSKIHNCSFPLQPYRKKSSKSGKSEAKCPLGVVPSRVPITFSVS